MKLMCNAVFEVGGVRGIGHVGAANALEKAGYEFQNFAGSSAGAIVAALLAVGYNTGEIKHELEKLNYKNFKQKSLFGKLIPCGDCINSVFKYGIYSTDYFYKWFSGLLQKKNITRFGDLKATNSNN